MKKFTDGSSRLILIVCGLMTAGVGIISVSPDLFLEKLFKLDYIQDYDIIIRHWSASIFVVGIFLIISAFIKNWRIPIVLFAIIEKLYLVVTCVFAMKYAYGKPFAITIPLDTAMCLLLAFVLLKEFGRIKGKEASSISTMS